MVAFEQIVKAIIVLAVLAVAIAIPLNLLMGKDTNLVRTMLGLGGNISELDKGIVDEFKVLSGIHKTASESMLGLTYSINSLAVADYHNKWKDVSKLEETVTKRSEEYDFKGYNTNVNVKTIPWGLKSLRLTSDDAKNNADNAKLKLTMAVVDCWRRYKDEEFANKNCQQIYVNKEFTETIKEGDIEKWIKDKKNVGKLKEEYAKIHPSSKDVEDYVDLAEDLLGNGFFNEKELHWVFKDTPIIDNKAEKGEIVICGNDRGTFGFKGILITDDWLNCETAQEKSTKYAYLVENFELPQELREGHSFYNPISWLETHGDPQYLVYYEAFPKGEDKQWEHFSWETFAVGVGIAVAAEGAGYAAVKLASPVWKITKAGGRLVLKIPGVKALGELSEKGIKELLEKIGIKMAKEAAEKSTKELSEEGIEKVLKVALRQSDTFAKEIPEEVGENMIKEVKGTIINWQKYPGYMQKYLRNGVLTKEGVEALNTRLTMEFGESVSKEAIDEISEIAAKASKDAFDPKFLGKLFSAKNGRKILQDSFESAQETYTNALKEGTGEAAEKAAREVLEESLDPTFKLLEKLDPQDLAKIMKKNKDAAKLVWKPGEGIDWTIFGGKPLTAMDDWSKIVGKSLEGNKFSNMMLGGTASFVKGHEKDWLILASSMIVADMIMSKQAKYINIGENALGLKVPNEDVVIYGQRKGIWKDTLLTTEWNTDKEEFLKNYGKGGNVGLLPEVGSYYLQLEKDKLNWWPDQDPARFFLASPCKADVYLITDRCECYGNEEEDLDPPNYAKDFSNGKFTNNKVTYRQTGEYDIPTKICNPNSWLDDDIGRSEYSPICIKINPLIDQTYPNNFCYSGSHLWQEVTQYSLRAMQAVDLILATAGGVCTIVTGGACAVIAVPAWYYMMAIAGGAEAGIRLIERTKAWPDHGSGT